jgi:hypothetical protein
MAIGFLLRRRLVTAPILTALALTGMLLRGAAEDQIVQKSGTTITGEITGVADGMVTVTIRTPSGGTGRIPYRLSDIQSVMMTPPVDLAKLQGAPPATVIAALTGPVQQFAGLPADWVVDAMAQLADAQDTAGNTDAATALYAKINQLYPNSAYQSMAIAGQARQSLKAGQFDQAIAQVQPIIAKANQNLAPSPAEGRLYANAFLVYGEALEAQKKPGPALEAYLTVTTMFYQNPALVQQAQQLAQNLRTQNPGVGVD